MPDNLASGIRTLRGFGRTDAQIVAHLVEQGNDEIEDVDDLRAYMLGKSAGGPTRTARALAEDQLQAMGVVPIVRTMRESPAGRAALERLQRRTVPTTEIITSSKDKQKDFIAANPYVPPRPTGKPAAPGTSPAMSAGNGGSPPMDPVQVLRNFGRTATEIATGVDIAINEALGGRTGETISARAGRNGFPAAPVVSKTLDFVDPGHTAGAVSNYWQNRIPHVPAEIARHLAKAACGCRRGR